MPEAQQLSVVCAREGCSDIPEDGEDAVLGLCDDCLQSFEDDLTWECEGCGDRFLAYEDRYNCPTALHREIHSHLTATFLLRASYITAYDEMTCGDCSLICEYCDNVYLSEEAVYECCPDERGAENVNIHTYNWRPESFRFWKMHNGQAEYTYNQSSSLLYIGMELEMEKAVHYVDDFLARANEPMGWGSDTHFVYFKHDGSLSHNGVELVTMPATPDAFEYRFPWDALQYLHTVGARSYAYENCGMHFHVSKNSFTPVHMWNFAKFQMNNSRRCSEIARRFNSSWARWEWDSRGSVIDIVKGKHTNQNRYVALNFQNRDTIELRYFKGNITKNGILRNVQFIAAVYEYTKTLTVPHVRNGGLKWVPFVAYVSDNRAQYPLLFDELNTTEQQSDGGE